jgi:hypothetical protein
MCWLLKHLLCVHSGTGLPALSMRGLVVTSAGRKREVNFSHVYCMLTPKYLFHPCCTCVTILILHSWLSAYVANIHLGGPLGRNTDGLH